MSATVAAKRDALATLVTSTLWAIDATWLVDTRLRAAVLKNAEPTVRKRIMGSPVRYAVVLHEGHDPDVDPRKTTAQDVPQDTIDVFRVAVWVEFKDHDTYASSSQSTFDTALFGSAGLVPVLRDTPWLTSAVAALGVPRNAEPTITALDDAGTLLAHFCDFTIHVI